MDYDWDLTKQAVEILLRLRKQDRDVLINGFDQLAERPFSVDTEFSFELDGKPYHTKTFSKYIVTFTLDHPIRMLHILSIE
jgi:hypothetical protein